MKRSEKIILIIQIISIILSILFILFNDVVNEYMIAILLTIIFLILYKLLGFESIKTLNSKKIIRLIIFLTISFIILTYSLGFSLGFVRTSYSLKPIIIIKNILPTLLIILSKEILRYQFLIKGSRNRLIIILTYIIFILIDTIVGIRIHNLNNKTEILKLICNIVIPSICNNILLNDLSYRYGYKVTIIYSLIMSLYIYFVPIFPDLDIYLDSIIKVLIPISILFIINRIFLKKKKYDLRNKNILSKVSTVGFGMFILIIICLNSNLFRYWIAVIGSGSMEPTINIGDAVIVDKIYQNQLEKLNKGDILVFKYNNKIYTHRIILIDKVDKEYFIKTKGDRRENGIDNWIVKNDDVIGVVKFKIKYIGYPTVWLNELIKGSDK